MRLRLMSNTWTHVNRFMARLYIALAVEARRGEENGIAKIFGNG